MATVMEMEFEKHDERFASCRINVDGKDYLIMARKSTLDSGIVFPTATVVAGSHWIDNMRSLGKTFWEVENIAKHYKRHGTIILEYVHKLLAMVA